MGYDAKLGSFEPAKGEKCEVAVSGNLFDADNPLLADTLKSVTGSDTPKIMLVADVNVVNRQPGVGTAIGRYINKYGITLAGKALQIGGGEKIKSDDMQTARRVMDAAVESKTGVGDVMLVMGGGALFDVAGYAAAQIRGGMKTVRIPTTTSAAVDAAFSTYSAIDTPNVKDAFRVQCSPSAVLMDFSFLFTVLDGVWRGGLGEIVRHASVSNAPLMRKIAKEAQALKNKDRDVSIETITACIESRIKKGTGDFALWSAHRLEAMSSYKLPHGYAVPIGICIDFAYAREKGYVDDETQETACRALADCGALDGLPHSNHLLSRTDSILLGLDAWALSNPGMGIEVPAGPGKKKTEENPDRDVFEKVIREFVDVSTSS